MRVFTISLAITVYESESHTQLELESSLAEDVHNALNDYLPVCGISEITVKEVTRLVEIIGKRGDIS